MLIANTYDLIATGADVRSESADQIAALDPKARFQYLVSRNAVRLSGLSSAQRADVENHLRQEEKFDVFIVPAGFSAKDIRLMAFDMDSTLTNMECIDDMAKILGRGPEVAAITHGAMQGSLSFEESLKKRCALLQGMTRAQVKEVVQDTKLNPGAEHLLAFCREHGIETWIVSGGFTVFTEPLVEKLHMRGTICNELEFRNDVLTGQVSGMGGTPIVDADGKARALERLCRKAGIPITKALACGDGANDIKMVKEAGIGVAYHGKPILQQIADCRINHGGLDEIELLFCETWG